MCVCLPVTPLGLYPWKGTASTGPKGASLSKESYCPTTLVNLAHGTPLAVKQPTLIWNTQVGLRDHEEVSQNHSRPSTIGSIFHGSNQQPQLHKYG